MTLKQQATDHAVQHATALAGSKVATGMTYGGLGCLAVWSVCCGLIEGLAPAPRRWP